MPQPKKGYSLASSPSHQRQMLSNLALSLFEHERIQTTEAKAKLLRPYAERLITKAKKGSVHHRRQVLSAIEDRAVVHKLFADIAPRFADRSGGYTRILKVGPRGGDGAPMALIELVTSAPATRTEEQSAEGGGRRRRRRRRPAREEVSAETQARPEPSAEADPDDAGDEIVPEPDDASGAGESKTS